MVQNMFTDYPDMLTVAQLQQALHIGRNSAYGLIKSGGIRSLRVGKGIRIPKRYLLDYIEKSCYNREVAVGESIPLQEELS